MNPTQAPLSSAAALNRNGFILGLSLLSSIAARADLFRFDVYLENGPFAGEVYSGSFVTTPGDGLKSPDDSSLLSFNLTAAGTEFTMTDDVWYGQGDVLGLGHGFPYVEIQGGGIHSINYLGEVGPSQLALVFLPELDSNFAAYSPDGLFDADGFLRDDVSQGFVTTAPDGGLPTAALLLMSVCGVASFSAVNRGRAMPRKPTR